MSERINLDALKGIVSKLKLSSESTFYNAEADDFEEQKNKAQLRELNLTLDLRERFAYLIFALVTVWLFLLMSFLFMQGMQCIDFELSDSLLITLISSTTATVLSYFLWVVQFLFPKPKK